MIWNLERFHIAEGHSGLLILVVFDRLRMNSYYR